MRLAKHMPCTFKTAYKEKVPISRRNRNFMGWMMGLEPNIKTDKTVAALVQLIFRFGLRF